MVVTASKSSVKVDAREAIKKTTNGIKLHCGVSAAISEDHCNTPNIFNTDRGKRGRLSQVSCLPMHDMVFFLTLA